MAGLRGYVQINKYTHTNTAVVVDRLDRREKYVHTGTLQVSVDSKR